MNTPAKFEIGTTEKKNVGDAQELLGRGMISRDQDHIVTELATPQLGGKNKRCSKESYEDDLTN